MRVARRPRFNKRGLHKVPLLRFPRISGIVASALVGGLAVTLMAQQPPRRFGGAYAELDERRQQLIGDWVSRFANVTGQRTPPAAFYDDVLTLSAKTTFDAVTHALMTTPLTDASGQALGDGLSLVERVDSVKGEAPGTASDRQFRMYVRLTPDARGHAAAIAPIQARRRQRHLPQGLSAQLSRAARHALDSGVDRAGRPPGRCGRRLSIVELPRHVVQRSLERFELGRPLRR
jgi:hypothetical protein